MTQDYKDLLLKYISGNTSTQIQTSPPILNRGGNRTNDLYTELNTQFEYGWNRKGAIQCKDSEGNLNGIIAWYGIYFTDIDMQTSKGFIAILDTNLNLLQIATQYNTGTDFGEFLRLKVDTDGKIYGIDFYNERPRFIMINNISVKSQITDEYTFVLRQSYYLQGNVANIVNGNQQSIILDKNPNGSNYIIGSGDPTILIEYLTLFTINVGSTNEWTDYTTTLYGGGDLDLHQLAGYYVKWQDNKPIIYAYDSYQGQYFGNTTEYVDALLIMSNGNINTTNITMKQNINLRTNMFTNITGNNPISDNFGASLVCINENNFYLAQGIYTEGATAFNMYARVMHYNNGTIDLIYTPEAKQIKLSDSGAYNIQMIENTLFLEYVYPANRYGTSDNYTYVNDVVLTMFDNQYRYDEEVAGSYNRNLTNPYYTIITKEFNLYKINTAINDYTEGNIIDYIYSIYNSLNYNGLPYEEPGALAPQQVFLYDENDNIIFARNLYNKVINGNTTEATVEVPNTMLNDIQIAKQDLIGKSNYVLVENEDLIEKNIYETLYINFFNTLMIQNRNNPIYVNNLPGATRLNNSISVGLDVGEEYYAAKITKIRINYTDNTSIVKNIESSIINNRVATITSRFFVGKLVNTIEIISNDEQTTYQTISGSTLQAGKFYTIEQDCYVE